MLEKLRDFGRLRYNRLVDRKQKEVTLLEYPEAIKLIGGMNPNQTFNITPRKPLPKEIRRDLIDGADRDETLEYLAKILPEAMQEGLSAQHTIFSGDKTDATKHYIDIFRASLAFGGTPDQPAKREILTLDYCVRAYR